MKYRILKTGLEVFDLSRAYGLYAILFEISKGSYIYPTLFNYPYFYLISFNETVNLDINNIADYLFERESFGWREITSITRELKLEDVKKTLLEEIEKGIPENIKASFGKKEKGRDKTIYACLDANAIKGNRSELAKLDEKNLFVDPLNWALASLGSAIAKKKVEIKRKDEKFKREHHQVLILFQPKKLEVRNLQKFRSLIQNIYFGYSDFQVCIYLSLKILQEILLTKDLDIDIQLENVFYQTFQSTGKGATAKYKVKGGGKIDLTFLNALIEENSDIINELFEKWIRILNENEKASIYLAHFLAEPNIDSWEMHCRTLLRYILTPEQNKKIEQAKQFLKYQESEIKEVIKKW